MWNRNAIEITIQVEFTIEINKADNKDETEFGNTRNWLASGCIFYSNPNPILQ